MKLNDVMVVVVVVVHRGQTANLRGEYYAVLSCDDKTKPVIKWLNLNLPKILKKQTKKKLDLNRKRKNKLFN